MTDPSDWQFESGKSYTRAEFDAVPRPVCPACGRPMNVERKAVPDPGSRVMMYLPGRVSCLTPGCLGPRR